MVYKLDEETIFQGKSHSKGFKTLKKKDWIFVCNGKWLHFDLYSLEAVVYTAVNATLYNALNVSLVF